MEGGGRGMEFARYEKDMYKFKKQYLRMNNPDILIPVAGKKRNKQTIDKMTDKIVWFLRQCNLKTVFSANYGLETRIDKCKT